MQIWEFICVSWSDCFGHRYLVHVNVLVLKSRAVIQDLTSTSYMGNVWFSAISITLEAVYERSYIGPFSMLWRIPFDMVWIFRYERMNLCLKRDLTGVCRIYCVVCVGQLMILFYFLEIWYTFGTHVNVSVSAGHWRCTGENWEIK